MALLEAVAPDVRPATLALGLDIMAQADLRGLLPQIRGPTMLLWGELDARSPLAVAHQFRDAVPGAQLVLVEGAGT